MAYKTPQQEFEALRATGISSAKAWARMSTKNKRTSRAADNAAARAIATGGDITTWVVGEGGGQAVEIKGGKVNVSSSTPDPRSQWASDIKNAIGDIADPRSQWASDIKNAMSSSVMVEQGDTADTVASRAGVGTEDVIGKTLTPGTALEFKSGFLQGSVDTGNGISTGIGSLPPGYIPGVGFSGGGEGRDSNPDAALESKKNLLLDTTPFQGTKFEDGSTGQGMLPGKSGVDSRLGSSNDIPIPSPATKPSGNTGIPGPKLGFDFQGLPGNPGSQADYYAAMNEQTRDIYNEEPMLRMEKFGSSMLGLHLYEEQGLTGAIDEIGYEPWVKPFTVNYLNQFPGTRVYVDPKTGELAGNVDWANIDDKTAQRLDDLGMILPGAGATIINGPSSLPGGGGGGGGGRKGVGGYSGSSQIPYSAERQAELVLKSWRI